MLPSKTIRSVTIAATLAVVASMTTTASTQGSSGRSMVVSKLAVGDATTVGMKDVIAAADRKFLELDTDKDGLLDSSELAGIATFAEQQRADTDKDHALNKSEYLALVKREFESADTDRDGLLDDKELSTQAGVDLVALLKY
jgi:Ca2+-binding EF-hand superfamily protein